MGLLSQVSQKFNHTRASLDLESNWPAEAWR